MRTEPLARVSIPFQLTGICSQSKAPHRGRDASTASNSFLTV
jgi:hypothetical protein